MKAFAKKMLSIFAKALAILNVPLTRSPNFLLLLAGIQIALIARVSKISINNLPETFSTSSASPLDLWPLGPPPRPTWVLKVDTTVVDSKMPSMEGSCAKLSIDFDMENLGKSTSWGQCSSIFWGRTCFSMSC